MARVVKMGETRAKRSLIRVNKSSCPAVVGGLSSPSNFIDLYRTYHIERIYEEDND